MLRNVVSNKYLNIHEYDKDEMNVYQKTADYSMRQTFRIVYDSSYNSYRLYSMASINGRFRVLDIVKSGGAVTSGCNVQLYKPTDTIAQLFKIVKLDNNTFKIIPNSNQSLALTSYGTLDGLSTGINITSAVE